LLRSCSSANVPTVLVWLHGEGAHIDHRSAFGDLVKYEVYIRHIEVVSTDAEEAASGGMRYAAARIVDFRVTLSANGSFTALSKSGNFIYVRAYDIQLH
jgi:hypothetical protein